MTRSPDDEIPAGCVRLPYPMRFARAGHEPTGVEIRPERPGNTYTVALTWPVGPPTTHRGLTYEQALVWALYADGRLIQ